MPYGKFKTGKAKPRPLPTPPGYIPGSGSRRAKPMPNGIDELRSRGKGTPPTPGGRVISAQKKPVPPKARGGR
jgi:hypothetical protein